jgi:hypothetical protein
MSLIVLRRNLPRLNKLIKLVAHFFSFQILIQATDAFSGLIIVRHLSKPEYAYFGIASTLAVSILNIAIGGLGSYLIAEGVSIKEQLPLFSKMYLEINGFINRKKWIILGISIPVIVFMYYRNNLNNFRITGFIVIIAIDVVIRVRMQLYQSVFNIWERFNVMQAINLVGSASRLLLVVVFSGFFTAEMAYFSVVLSYGIQLCALLYYGKGFFVPVSNIDRGRYPEFQKLYLSQLPSNLYVYIDAQLGVFIVTFFGNISLLADLNAASKLSLIVVAVNAFINNFMIVQFAKLKTKLKFIKFLLVTCSFFVMIYLVATILIYKFPMLFIFLIGEKYKNIAPLLYLVVLNICIANFSGLIGSINYSKMWIKKNWVAIPFTILLQITMLKYLPPKDFSHVWYYAMISAIPTLFVNSFFCVRGIRKMAN